MATETTPLQPSATPHFRFRVRRAAVAAVTSLLVLAVVAVVWLKQRASPARPQFSGALSGLCGATKQDTGYVQLSNKKDSKYFYWYVESNLAPETAPLVLWMTGGPGGSSMYALLVENGPCSVNPDLTTKLNPFSWSNEANMLWVDQPTNVGFSYSSEPEADADTTVNDVAINMYGFLQGFIDQKHPELRGRPFFIAGESYGGHYVPAVSHFIWQQNKLEQDTTHHINLQGISIGNGETNPAVQTPHFIDMADNAYNITFMNSSTLEAARAAAGECGELLVKCEGDESACMDALDFCSDKLEAPLLAAKRNPYDIREPCDTDNVIECLHTDDVASFLDLPAIRKALNVDARVGPWQMCNFEVNTAFAESWDISKSLSGSVADLLNDGIRVLIYAGDADLMCNWYGNLAWMRALEWDGADAFNASKTRRLALESSSDGEVVGSGLFTFVRVFNAGHMVPANQPAVALALLSRFLKNESL